MFVYLPTLTETQIMFQNFGNAFLHKPPHKGGTGISKNSSRRRAVQGINRRNAN